MTERLLKLSISKNFLDKNPLKTNNPFKEGFDPYELTLDELAQVINMGMTISYQFAGGVRNAENFLATDLLAVDIDDGMTLSEARDHPLVLKYCSLLYTTASHTPEAHRFRLIFILPRTITLASEIKAASRALANRLGGDKAATDAARMFHGSKDSEPLIFENSIDDAFLDELIADGQIIPASESISYSGKTANRSEFHPDIDLQVRTSNGQIIDAVSVISTTSIYCLFHTDRRPSAFISRNKAGSVFLHCASCSKTWWLTNNFPNRDRFDDFEETVTSLNERDFNKQDHPTLITLFQDASDLRPENVHVGNSRHIVPIKINDGLTFIKSPKGSGKTTFMTSQLELVISAYPTLEDYEEDTDFETEKSFYSDTPVLLIGHRQALIGELCKRLHLNCYLEDKLRIDWETQRKTRYGVCLDSLWTVKHMKYHTIIIDEVEQVLAHFLSDTIGDKREAIFTIFSQLLRKAKRIIALDADLGWVSFTTLTALTREEELPTSPIHLEKMSKKPIVPTQIYINQHKVENRECFIYPNPSLIMQHLKKSLVQGRRVFVCSNSKKKIKAIEKSIELLEKNSGLTFKRILITSENSQKKDVQTFIKNVAAECLNYQVILSSPSLGTGIDISFDNDEQLIDVVYGLFENQINTHFEIDQQLYRVRNPKEVHIWISPRTFKFETEFEVVQHDFLQRNLITSITDGVAPISPPASPDEVSPFLKMATLIISQQRASKNWLKNNFMNYRESSGWTVTEVAHNKTLRQEGLEFFREGKKLAKEESIDIICQARVLEESEFKRIETLIDQEEFNDIEDQWASFHRTKIELFYRQPIDRQLVLKDREGKHRTATKLFEFFSSHNAERLMDMIGDGARPVLKFNLEHRLFVDRTTQINLMWELLETTPFFVNHQFDPEVKFTKADLKEFVGKVAKLKMYIEPQFGLPIPRDLYEKPPHFLNRVLSQIGLKHQKIKKSRTGIGSVYTYQLDRGKLDEMNALIKRRSEIEPRAWEYLNRFYGFTPMSEGDDDIGREPKNLTEFNQMFPTSKRHQELFGTPS